jgi:multicomponent Na+:H+ antiporter subunit D
VTALLERCMPHLVVAPILLPMATAAVMLWMGEGRRPWKVVLGIGSMLAGLATAVALLWWTSARGPVTYVPGGWPAAAGIAVVADRLSALMLVLAWILGPSAVVFSAARWHRAGVHFHPLLQLQLMGLSGAFLAGDLFNLFVGFEILLFSSYVLITLGGAASRIHAGTTYVVVSLLSSALFLIGIAATYAATGTVNLAQLSIRIGDLDAGVALVLQLCLLTAFAIKAAVFPMSAWLPDSYPTAPAPVTAVFAGLLTKVGVYAIIRTQTLLFPESPLTGLLLWAALLTMVIGILGAVSQSGLKRILSFTLVSHIGYMIFGIALSTQAGTAGAIFYVVHHILIQTSLFLITGLVERVGGSTSLHRLGGLAMASPVLATLFFVSAMNLSGVPPLSGFLAKIGLLDAGIAVGTPLAWVVVVGGIATSLLTLYALSKVWSQAFWRPLAETREVAELAAEEAADVAAEFEQAERDAGRLTGALAGGTATATIAPTGVADAVDTSQRALPRMMLGATAAMTAVGLLLTLLAGPLHAFTERAAADLQQRAPYITSVLPEEVRR